MALVELGSRECIDVASAQHLGVFSFGLPLIEKHFYFVSRVSPGSGHTIARNDEVSIELVVRTAFSTEHEHQFPAQQEKRFPHQRISADDH